MALRGYNRVGTYRVFYGFLSIAGCEREVVIPSHQVPIRLRGRGQWECAGKVREAITSTPVQDTAKTLKILHGAIQSARSELATSARADTNRPTEEVGWRSRRGSRGLPTFEKGFGTGECQHSTGENTRRCGHLVLSRPTMLQLPMFQAPGLARSRWPATRERASRARR